MTWWWCWCCCRRSFQRRFAHSWLRRTERLASTTCVWRNSTCESSAPRPPTTTEFWSGKSSTTFAASERPSQVRDKGCLPFGFFVWMSPKLHKRHTWWQGELIGFWGHKVKGQGHSETTYDQLNNFGGGGIFAPIQNAWTYCNETVTHYQIHLTLIFQGQGFRVQGHRQHCLKMHCSRGGLPIDRSSSKTLSFVFFFRHY